MSDMDDCRRILCVDDEPNVLEGLERNLFDEFDVSTARSGLEGLNMLRTEGPFAVVVSDMQMPTMNGAIFLTRVRKLSPHTVRILLTGHADIDAAISAVNDGNIFRFLLKPCPVDMLTKSLNDAVELYRLVNAEKELLEKTVAGSAKVFINILSLASPTAFSRAEFVKRYMQHMVGELELKEKWPFELAAMLSQIGCITLPPDTMNKVYAGQEISNDEKQMLTTIPQTGYDLLSSIPRFEGVAEMIKRQNDVIVDTTDGDEVLLGASMLRVALKVDQLVAGGLTISQAVGTLKNGEENFEARFLDILAGFRGGERGDVIKAVSLKELKPFMVLDEDVLSADGQVIIGKGHEVSLALKERLENFSRRIGIAEPIRVRVVS